MSINPFDETVEEIRQEKIFDEVIVVSIGNSSVKETIRSSFGYRSHRGLLTDINLEPLVAKICLKYKKNNIDIAL